MSYATIESIRDRALTLVEAITPTILPSDKFRRYRNELAGNFDEWAEKNPAAALRRFQLRSRGDDTPPDVSSTIEERVQVTLELRIAYPQNNRAGNANALDRDDLIETDWLKLNAAIGLYSRANFSGTNDCTPLGGDKEVERGAGVDYLVVRLRYEYVRQLV